MKWSLLMIAAVTALVAAGAGWARLDQAAAQQDVAAGGGRFGPGCSDGTSPFCHVRPRDFSIDARANPTDHGASGTLIYGSNGFGTAARGRVTCIRVDGNRAVVGGWEIDANGAETGNGVALYVIDNGEPGSATRDRSSPAQIMLPSELPDGWPRECPALDNDAFGAGYEDVESGDIQVNDEIDRSEWRRAATAPPPLRARARGTRPPSGTRRVGSQAC